MKSKIKQQEWLDMLLYTILKKSNSVTLKCSEIFYLLDPSIQQYK